MEVILYSTHCPKCNVLKAKLEQKNVQFQEVNDIEVMMKKGFLQAPVLQVDGINYDFVQASKLINNL